jgi:hypothetical protein
VNRVLSTGCGMMTPTIEDLARQAATGDGAAREVLLEHLEAVFRLLDPVLLDRVVRSAAALRSGPSRPGAPAAGPLTPELLEWASQDLNHQEIAADLRDVREKGGLVLENFLPELERIVEGP